jgi:cyclopropane fatty-acyl-phospholipid synthase-like methyltransferase
VTGPVFEFSEVFDEDYLYFYAPHLEAVSDAHAETVWRLLDLEPGMEVLDLACGHGRMPTVWRNGESTSRVST